MSAHNRGGSCGNIPRTRRCGTALTGLRSSPIELDEMRSIEVLEPLSLRSKVSRMHATRHNPADDSDLEDIVVYADEISGIGRAAQVPKLVHSNGSPECLSISP